MTAVRSRPCSACPYRRDVPSGIWSAAEYEKLRWWDAETWAQPFNGFACHATPDHHCAGWAIVGSNRGGEYELLALRINWPDGGIPETDIPLFSSGSEAADHGERDIDNPSPAARELAERLLRKYPRLGTDP